MSAVLRVLIALLGHILILQALSILREACTEKPKAKLVWNFILDLYNKLAIRGFQQFFFCQELLHVCFVLQGHLRWNLVFSIQHLLHLKKTVLFRFQLRTKMSAGKTACLNSSCPPGFVHNFSGFLLDSAPF